MASGVLLNPNILRDNIPLICHTINSSTSRELRHQFVVCSD